MILCSDYVPVDYKLFLTEMELYLLLIRQTPVPGRILYRLCPGRRTYDGHI